MEDLNARADEIASSRHFAVFLVLTSLLCGALIMVVEVLGSRVVGPFFGVSLFVWSSLIAVTMIALAAGYALGGILSDRLDHPDYLYGIIMVSGVLVMGIPFVKGMVLKACLPLGLRAGAFASSSVLFGPPLLLLGCVSPYIIRIAAREMRSIGRTVGSFYAISTIGSVVGTVATGFVLIVYVGVSQIFYLVGALLLALAVAYFVWFRKKLGAAVALLLPLALLAIPEHAGVSVALADGTVASVVLSKDTYYGNTKIVDYRYGSRHTREMVVDGVIQSAVDMNTGMSISPYPYLLEIVPHSLHPVGKRCLVVGLGGGVIPRWYEDRGIRTDVVDIDPYVVQLARDYFGYAASGRTVVADARYFLMNSEERYDYIVLDVFSGESAPSHIISLEALQVVRECLTEQGVLAINFAGYLEDDNHMTASVVKTLRAAFDNVDLYPNFDPQQEEPVGNIALIAYNGAAKSLSPSLPAGYPIHPFAAKAVWNACRRKYDFPVDAGGVVLTDDYNPIDCYDNRVKEAIRRGVLRSTHWDILAGGAGAKGNPG